MKPAAGVYRQVQGGWIHEGAKVAGGVSIEPGAVIGAEVEVGRGSWIGAGAVIYGPTVLGEENQVHPTAVLGGAPQEVGYRDEPTRLLIGDRNIFREGVTVSRGSVKGGGVTRIGSNSYLMSGSHIGHDCQVGDHVVLANDVLIAGHCRVGDHVNMAGGVAIVQFSTVGRYAFVGGLSGTTMDCEPFIVHDGMPARPRGLNLVGLRRGLFSHDVLNRLKEAYRVLFTDSMKGGEDLEAARHELERRGAICQEVLELLEFMERSRQGKFGRQGQGHQAQGYQAQGQPQRVPKLALIPEAPPRARKE
jgi:UDP-N-acetylglucosamine acyltransferase